ncbi:MAG: hypothetical protein CMD86_01710 [Gammaproteobacteria bacterium]|nr:hypothetical protein [Gammaproteobacteria bacterium]|tara:strand:- start:154 stop:924 length:771 start_codon:yes stop_codon:yes gene_type:complete
MKTNITMDLNADLGEYTSRDELINEISLIEHITSASIACGGHAGDQESIATMIKHCIRHNVLYGPHPSYPDKKGFGRKRLSISDEILIESIIDQVSFFFEIAKSLQAEPTHVKFHGQLYNDCFSDEKISQLCLSAMQAVCPNMALMCQPYSAISNLAERSGIKVINEAFVDRRYQSNGALMERITADAVISSLDERSEQAALISCEEKVIAENAREIEMKADTLCIHSDHSESIETAIAIKEILEKYQCQIKSYDI